MANKIITLKKLKKIVIIYIQKRGKSMTHLEMFLKIVKDSPYDYIVCETSEGHTTVEVSTKDYESYVLEFDEEEKIFKFW